MKILLILLASSVACFGQTNIDAMSGQALNQAQMAAIIPLVQQLGVQSGASIDATNFSYCQLGRKADGTFLACPAYWDTDTNQIWTTPVSMTAAQLDQIVGITASVGVVPLCPVSSTNLNWLRIVQTGYGSGVYPISAIVNTNTP